MVFKVLTVGHILADFYFQSRRLAEEKKKSLWKLFLHCIIYFVIVGVVIWMVTAPGQWSKVTKTLVYVSVLHGFVDCFKIKLEQKSERLRAKSHIIFLADQICHLGILFILFSLTGMEMSENSIIYEFVSKEILEKWIMPIICGLVCWRPASIFVSLIFSSIPGTIMEAEEESKCNGQSVSQCPEKQESAKIGSWIGILEREIILVLGLMEQFGAIGFVLTAKSLARYKQLENKAFAEKYLVGTLVSTFIAIVCVSLCRIGGL